MTIGERIKACRKDAGLSQEKVAEALGVSRQAVTKWETGQSNPGTENLFKLAELFGTTVDLLLEKEATAPSPDTDTAKTIVHLLLEEEKAKKADLLLKRKQNIRNMFLVILSYLLIYLLGRFLWCSREDSSFLGWLIVNQAAGEHSYLYGWLLSSELFWYSMLISALPALFGKRKFACTTVAAFTIGLVAGILFGPNPEGAAIGQSHFGWAIWGCIFLLSIPSGILVEKWKK